MKSFEGIPIKTIKVGTCWSSHEGKTPPWGGDIYWGYIGDNGKMETAIVYWGYYRGQWKRKWKLL